MSIIKELGGLVTNQIIKSASNSLGESDSAIGKVISGLAPTILAGMLNKSSDAGAFGQIFDMLNRKENVSYLDNLEGMLTPGNIAQGDPRDAAGSMLGSLFGDKVGGILDMITALGGVKRDSTSSLLGMVGPMIMGYLGKKILNQGLSATGLASYLGTERNNIASAIPNQLADFIGFDVNETVADKAAAAVTGAATTASTAAKSAASSASGAVNTAASTAQSGGSGLLKYLLPLLLVAGAFFAWRACGTDVKNAGEKVADVTTSAVDGASDAASDMAKGIGEAAKDISADAANAASGAVAGLGQMLSRALPGGVSLNVPENGIESQVIAFIEDEDKVVDKTTWFNFDRLNFATGSADLDMEKSREQIDNIAAILTAYPNVNIKIGGYTDNTGNAEANMKLSEARAQTVMLALVNKGIAPPRMAAEGYGDAHPVASNDTADGRAQNRRIALRVTKK
ncbi:MAG: OmpA family protein [Bacteroidota bacterium]